MYSMSLLFHLRSLYSPFFTPNTTSSNLFSLSLYPADKQKSFSRLLTTKLFMPAAGLNSRGYPNHRCPPRVGLLGLEPTLPVDTKTCGWNRSEDVSNRVSVGLVFFFTSACRIFFFFSLHTKMNDSTKDTLYKVLIDCNKRDGVVDFFMNIRLLMSQRLLFTGVLFLLSSTWVSPVVTQDLLFSGKHQKRWFEIKLTWPLDWLVPLLKWMGWLDHYVLFQPKIIKKKIKSTCFIQCIQ